MSKIVKFPENRIVRQDSSVSFNDMKKFLFIYNLAEEAGAIFNSTHSAVVFNDMDDFDKFVELLFTKLEMKS